MALKIINVVLHASNLFLRCIFIVSRVPFYDAENYSDRRMIFHKDHNDKDVRLLTT